MAMTVAARPTSRLIREPQMNWVITSRPSSSVPSGPNSDGLAKVGLSVVLMARRPASSASSGRGQRHRHDERDQDDQADHARAVAAELPPDPGQRAPPPQPGDPARGRDGGRAHAVRTRGSRYAYSRSAIRLNRITDALNTRNSPWSMGRSGPLSAS